MRTNLPRTPNLKLIVTTITFPCAANMEPSYGLPEFHSYDSPCMYTIVDNFLADDDVEDVEDVDASPVSSVK